jgi:hypothetical protein
MHCSLRRVSVLLISLCSVAVANADVVPSFVWDGSPAVYFLGNEAYASAAESPTGITISGDSFEPANTDVLEISVFAGLNVTSPGTFFLSASSGTGLEALACDPGSICTPSSTASVSANFSESVTAGLGYLVLSGSGSAASQGTEVFLNLSDAQSESITLGLGDYTLFEEYAGYARASGDVGIDFRDDISLVPAPEPRAGIVLLAMALLIPLGLRIQGTKVQ